MCRFQSLARQFAAHTALVVLSTLAVAGPVFAQGGASQGSDSVKVVRMYGDARGETHFEMIDMRPGVEGPQVTDKVRFVRFGADLNRTGATSDSLKYLVVLSGAGFEIEVSDGTKHQFRPGSILMTDDMKSKGHNIHALGGSTQVMYITVDTTAKATSK